MWCCNEGCLYVLHEAKHDVHENDPNQYNDNHPNNCPGHAAAYDGEHNEYEADNLPDLTILIGISGF